jgi:hypothetical protein
MVEYERSAKLMSEVTTVNRNNNNNDDRQQEQEQQRGKYNQTDGSIPENISRVLRQTRVGY